MKSVNFFKKKKINLKSLYPKLISKNTISINDIKPIQLAKKNVKRRFPKAITLVDSTGKIYVAQDGKDICNKELYKAVKRGASLEELNLIKEIKHTSTIFDAWLQAESMVTVNRVIESNTERFSDEKIINKNLEE